MVLSYILAALALLVLAMVTLASADIIMVLGPGAMVAMAAMTMATMAAAVVELGCCKTQ